MVRGMAVRSGERDVAAYIFKMELYGVCGRAGKDFLFLLYGSEERESLGC